MGRDIEKMAPAYLEIKDFHRKHPGTGSGKAADDYRNKQRWLLNNGRISQAGH